MAHPEIFLSELRERQTPAEFSETHGDAYAPALMPSIPDAATAATPYERGLVTRLMSFASLQETPPSPMPHVSPKKGEHQRSRSLGMYPGNHPKHYSLTNPPSIGIRIKDIDVRPPSPERPSNALLARSTPNNPHSIRSPAATHHQLPARP
jgi:hypothetical protein